MLKCRWPVLALAVLALGSSGLAQAKAVYHTKTYHFTVIAKLNSLGGTGIPAIGTEIGNLAGSGALVERGRITGHPESTAYRFKDTGTDIYSRGTIDSSMTGTLRQLAGGGASVRGHGTITGGSGSFHGAHGKYTFNGSLPAPRLCMGTTLTVRFTGTISY